MKQLKACPVGGTLALVSGKWKPFILFLISRNVNRFNLLEKTLNNISKKVLTTQLRGLEQKGLIVRMVYKEKHPQIVVYKITDSGCSLLELINKIYDWGTNNILEGELREQAKVAREKFPQPIAVSFP